MGVEVAIRWSKNRIDHKLPWAMVGSPTAAICLEHTNPQLIKRRHGGNDIFLTPSTTNGDYRRMLKQEQTIPDCP
jgi:hypothetical protein